MLRVHKGESHARPSTIVQLDQFLDGKAGSLFILNGSIVQPDHDEAAPQTFTNQAETQNEVRQVAATSTDVGTSSDVGTAAVETRSQDTYLRWDLNEQLDEATFDYIVSTPARNLPAAERLRFFAQNLESENDIISIDAFSEFAGASYQDIASIRDEFDRRKLREWIVDERTSPDRLGIFGMMLGLCGNDEDARFLKQQIGLPKNDELRFGVDGLMGGLLLLTKQEGLQFICETRIENTNASSMEAMAANNALDFIKTCEPDMFEPAELAASLHGFVARDDMRELTWRQLSRWQDWSLVGHLPSVYDASVEDEDSRSIEAIVGYLLAMQKTVKPEDVAEDDDRLAAAQELLTRIRKQHPRLVRNVERFVN